MLKVLRAKLGQIMTMRYVGYVFLGVCILGLFFWNVSNLTPGLSPAETAARTNSSTLQRIYENPINAPHKVLQLFFVKIIPNNITSLKLATIIFACLFGLAFYKLASAWFGKLIGLFGSLIFITMPLYIISARQASSHIMLFSPILLMWLYAWLDKTKKNKSLAWILLCIATGLLLYTPGIVWLVLAAAIICRRRLKSSLTQAKPILGISGLVIMLVTLVPLAISAINQPAVIRQLLLIPSEWSNGLVLVKNVGWAFMSLFVRAPDNNPLIIARLPIISVIVLALIIFGLYAMQVAARRKALWLSASIMFSVVASGLNDDLAYLALGIPGACLLASAGLRYLYIEWRAIFPRNPVPKTFALILIAALTATQVYYGVQYSLVAWPHTVATKSSYVLK